MSPIEAVARAICGRYNRGAGDKWWAYEDVARAAIEALAANVTDEMASAAQDRLCYADLLPKDAIMRDAISDSLRAALSDGPKGGG